MPPARAPARGAPARAPARGAAPARSPGATTAQAPGGAAVRVGGEAEKDPRFRKVIEQLEKGARQNKKHEPASQKAAQAQAAAVSPPSERSAGAKATQVDAMKEAETPKADPNGFLALLRAEIEKVMPKNLDDADKFMEGNETAQVKGAVAGGVSTQKDAAAGPTEDATRAAPDPSGVPGREAAPLPEEPAAPPPAINAAEAMPAPRPATEVSALQHGKQDAEKQLQDAEVTPEQLRKANDPRFSAVLGAKAKAEKVADAAPGKFRAGERVTLGQAAIKAQGDARQGLAQMGTVKSSAASKVKARQLLAKQKDEARRKEVTETIERLYQQTKQRVEAKLSTLESDVMRMFDVGAEAALTDMRDWANRAIDRFKDERYSGLDGAARWVADLFRPVPEGIKVILGQARARFATRMDALAVQISATVDNRLSEAKAEVTKGQAAIQSYVDGLPRDLQAVGRAAEKEMAGRFDELRNGIDARKNDLAQKLAQKYKEAHDKADAALKKLEEENQGALKGLADAIGEVIKVLTEFKDKLMAVLRKGADTIKLILADPIQFLSNLINAIKQGVQGFVARIGAHLMRGFMQWLFGALAQAGIPIPADLSLPSILKLVLGVLGITYERMRAKAVRLLGERTVGLLEKVFELVQQLVTAGPAAMWERFKENLGDLKAQVIDSLKTWLIETVIKAAVTRLVTMFNPAGAIVQAVLAIYNTVMFFIERASQIAALIEAIVNSVHAIATGSISGAATWIENALGRAVPVVIGFLARLIGLGNVSGKVRETIQKVQDAVDRAIDKALEKIVAFARRLFGRSRPGAGAADKHEVVEVPFDMKGASHTLKVAMGTGGQITMHSRAGVIAAKIGTAIQTIKGKNPPLDKAAQRISRLSTLRDNAAKIEKDEKAGKATAAQVRTRLKTLIESLKDYANTFDAKDIEDVLSGEFPPPKVGGYGALLAFARNPPLPDKKMRVPHHAPPVVLAVTLQAALQQAGNALNRDAKGTGKVLLDASRALGTATAGHGRSMPAILVHEQTHTGHGAGARIHGSEIRDELKAKLKAEGMPLEDLVYLQGDPKTAPLSVKPGQGAFQRQLATVSRSVAGTKFTNVNAAIKRHSGVIITRVYRAAAAQTLGAVEIAVRGSILDGPAGDREAQLTALRALAKAEWEDKLLKNILGAS